MTVNDLDASFADMVVTALTGQECTLVRDSLGNQLVVGFGGLRQADWPLRETVHASWLLYTSYGWWEVSDGVGHVASDDDPLDEAALQRARAVLFHQHVTRATVGPPTSQLAIDFDNGARLTVRPHPETAPDDDVWLLQAPNGVSIEAWADRLTVSRRHVSTSPAGSTTAAVHRLIRDVASRLGLALFEPVPNGDAGFDAVLSARDGTVILMQITTAGTTREHAIRTVTVRKGEAAPTSTDIDVTGLSLDAVTSEVRRVLSAA